MLKGQDFILNPSKMEKEFQLVEVSEWLDYDTKEKLGFHYIVLLPKLRFEKMKVSIKATKSFVTNEELEESGQMTVIFEGLKTWASVYNNRLSVKAEAMKVNKGSKS